MFDIGWSELLIIGVVALIAIGPKELPGVLRGVGQFVTKIRRMAGEFQGQFQEAMREAEMADIKKQVDELSDTARGFTNIDPLEKFGFDDKSLGVDEKSLGLDVAATPASMADETAGAASAGPSAAPSSAIASEPLPALPAEPPADDATPPSPCAPSEPQGGRAA